ncbi:15-hydroxyprostaglandin dehydrogenase [NAD(+)]-like [Glandiceps talaboti]
MKVTSLCERSEVTYLWMQKVREGQSCFKRLEVTHNLRGKPAYLTSDFNQIGIGRAITERLLEERIKGIAIIDINEDRGKKTESELTNKHGQGRIRFIKCDVTSKSDLEAAFQEAQSYFGGLDYVFNNAAVQDELDWETTVDVNLKGVIRGTYLAVKYLGTKHGGNGGIVINTASVTAFMAVPYLSVYGATKHGIVGFTRNIANDVLMTDNNIKVAAICPGKVDTPLQQKYRLRNPAEYKNLLDEHDFVP